MSTIQSERSLKDFTLSLFDQAVALIPNKMRLFFEERFEERSEFLFPALLFFYFAKKNFHRTDNREEVELETCELEVINDDRAYRLKLVNYNVWMVLMFGHDVPGSESKEQAFALCIYEDTPQLEFLMQKETIDLTTASPIVVISGVQDIEASPVCGVGFQKMHYHSDNDQQMKRMAFIAELIYAWNVLMNTTKVYKVIPPNAGTELGASHEAKKEKVKN